MPALEHTDDDSAAMELCAKGSARIGELTQAIVQGGGDSLRLANEIYWTAWQHGAWVGQPGEIMSAEATCPELADPGAEFLQLADALERYQDKADGRAAYGALIREAAKAYLGGQQFPDWEDRGEPVPWRPQ